MSSSANTINPDHVSVNPLVLSDDLGNFDCSEPHLNEFIRDQATGEHLEGCSTVYIARHGSNIVGFVSLSMSGLRIEVIRGRFQLRGSYTVRPALLIGRLGINNQFQRQGIGKKLVRFAIAVAIRIKRDVGCQFVIVNAKKESIEFYAKNKFTVGVGQERKDEPFMYFKLPNIEYCHNCKQELQPDAKFCGNCGTSADAS